MAVDKCNEMELGTVNHAFDDNDIAGNGETTQAESLQAIDDEHVYANVAEIARRDQIDDIDRFDAKLYIFIDLLHFGI